MIRFRHFVDLLRIFSRLFFDDLRQCLQSTEMTRLSGPTGPRREVSEHRIGLGAHLVYWNVFKHPPEPFFDLFLSFSSQIEWQSSALQAAAETSERHTPVFGPHHAGALVQLKERAKHQSTALKNIKESFKARGKADGPARGFSVPVPWKDGLRIVTRSSCSLRSGEFCRCVSVQSYLTFKLYSRIVCQIKDLKEKRF